MHARITPIGPGLLSPPTERYIILHGLSPSVPGAVGTEVVLSECGNGNASPPRPPVHEKQAGLPARGSPACFSRSRPRRGTRRDQAPVQAWCTTFPPTILRSTVSLRMSSVATVSGLSCHMTRSASLPGSSEPGMPRNVPIGGKGGERRRHNLWPGAFALPFLRQKPHFLLGRDGSVASTLCSV